MKNLISIQISVLHLLNLARFRFSSNYLFEFTYQNALWVPSPRMNKDIYLFFSLIQRSCFAFHNRIKRLAFDL